GKCSNHDVISNPAHFSQYVQSVPHPVANTIQVEENGVKVLLLQDAFDCRFVGSQGCAQLAGQTTLNFRIKFVVIGDYGKRVTFRASGRFKQRLGLRSLSRDYRVRSQRWKAESCADNQTSSYHDFSVTLFLDSFR